MKKLLTLMLMLLTFAFLSACFDSGSSTAVTESSSEDTVSAEDANDSDTESSSEVADTDKESSSEETDTDKESSSEEADKESSSEEADKDKGSSSEEADKESSSEKADPDTESSSEKEPVSSADETLAPGEAPAGSPVDMYGFLATEGNKLISVKTGEPVQLIGMSLFWSQWGPEAGGTFFNEKVVKWLALDWSIDIIRAALGVNEEGMADVLDEDDEPTGEKEAAPDGYLQKPEIEKAKIVAVIEASIEAGIYVIIDWHDHKADNNTAEAVEFFTEMAQTYGEYPNIIYEPFNEPQMPCADQANCAGHENPNFNLENIMKHQQTIIETIRKYDTKNHIALGSQLWSSKPGDVIAAINDGAINDPSNNISATMHIYAKVHWVANPTEGSHRTDVTAAHEENSIPIFASEWGTASYDTEVEGIGADESIAWMDWMKERKISWCNWALNDKAEANSALEVDASLKGNWGPDELSESGKLIRSYIRESHGLPGDEYPN
ncbi:MAG: cellulase family glycosylhydrolase [Fibrobacterales bacterium]